MAVSATRTTHVKLHRACRQAWWQTAVAQTATKGSAAMSFGSLAHRQLELWWRHGIAPTYPLVKAALPVLEQLFATLGVVPAFRAADSASRAEWNFKVLVLGWQYGGTSDLVLITPSGEIWVVDYKTTADAFRFGLTSQQLANDTQLGVYAWQAIQTFAPDVAGVHVAHLQLQRVDAQGRPHGHRDYEPFVALVQAWMPRERAQAIWAGVEETVRVMQADAVAAAADVPGNLEHCSAFGGCQFRARCLHHARAAAAPSMEPPMQPINPFNPPPPLPPAPPPVQPLPSSQGFWLLLDSSCQQGWQFLPQPYQHLDALLVPLQQRVAQLEGVPHYGMVDFAKGRAAVVGLLSQLPLPTGTVVVDTMTPCGEAVIEYLRPRAAVVLQRTR